MTGLTATASGGPAGLTVQLTAPSQIAGDGTATLGYSLDDTSTQGNSGVVTIQVTTDQGAVLSILVGVTVDPLTPVLATNPGYLDTGMVVGSQTLVSFTVVNNGGAPSGALQVSLPYTSYMTLASPATIPSLAPGASSTVTVELTPPANLPLEQYKGTIGIGGSQTGISVPFTFTAITTATGDVHVLVDDDYTFQEAGSPHVQGATVNLLNPYDNTQVVETGVTDASGAVTFTNVPAGPYDLQVTGDRPLELRQLVHRRPGHHEQRRGLHRRAVRHLYLERGADDDPGHLPDPAPDHLRRRTCRRPWSPSPRPSSIPTLVPGQSWTFNATITNHGLIAAQGVTLTCPPIPSTRSRRSRRTSAWCPPRAPSIVPITVTRVAPQSLSVSDGGTTFTANVVVPNPVGSDTASTVYVDYSNTGTVAIPAPLLVLTATQGSSQGAFLSLDPSLAGLAYNSNATPAGFSDTVQFLASGATPGMIEPGESEQIPVYYAGWLSSQWSRPLRSRSASARWTRTTPTPSTGRPWRRAFSSVRSTTPPGARSPRSWPRDGLDLGPVRPDARQRCRLSRRHRRADDRSRVNCCRSRSRRPTPPYTAQTLTSVTADSLPAPGMDLTFVQSFQQSISGRYTAGHPRLRLDHQLGHLRDHHAERRRGHRRTTASPCTSACNPTAASRPRPATRARR